MPKTADPIEVIPSAHVVRESLTEARRRVATLEFLLRVAEGVEDRLTSTTPTDAAEWQAVAR